MPGMKIRITQLGVPLDYTDEIILQASANRMGVERESVTAFTMVRRAIDGRRLKGHVRFILTVDVEVDDAAAEARREGDVAGAAHETPGQPGPIELARRPVVVGAGPAGLLAAWRLARAGAKPILIERGAPVAERRASVGEFWAKGTLDTESNALFGEGGAGLFSDGKLTTRSKQRGYLRAVLELLVECGGPEEILVEAEPHVGSDKLATIVQTLREQIVALGGEVRFHSRLESIELRDGQLAGVVVNGEGIVTDHCILATGHSARDVYRMLHAAQVPLAAKAFAAGVRIEFPQSQLDKSQFGPDAGHERLGPASFRLTRREEAGARACYTFCMCPGGRVIACSASAGELTTNGMSLSSRDGVYGNAGFLVPVRPEDFGGDTDPLAGLAWQEAIEAKAFVAGGSNYSVPALRLRDFLSRTVSRGLPANRSCSRSVPADLHAILPEFISETLLHAVPRMLSQLSDIRKADGIVYATETRSSSPVRILREKDFQSPGAAGLYPAGEGAGYAGGIVTSAIDGLRAADALLDSMT